MCQISTGPHSVVIHLSLLVCAILFDCNLSRVIQIPTHAGGDMCSVTL